MSKHTWEECEVLLHPLLIHLCPAGPTASYRHMEDAVWVAAGTSFILAVELPRERDLLAWSDKMCDRFMAVPVTVPVPAPQTPANNWMTAYDFTINEMWCQRKMTVSHIMYFLYMGIVIFNHLWTTKTDAHFIKDPGFCSSHHWVWNYIRAVSVI